MLIENSFCFVLFCFVKKSSFAFISMYNEVIAATILYNLRRKNKIGNKHTPLDSLSNGFPKHLRGEAKDIAKDLIRRGWINKKPTNYGLEVSLDKNNIIEIEKFVFRVMDFKF